MVAKMFPSDSTNIRLKATHGTLVIAIPTLEGLVIAADKRGSTSANDDETKIFQISKFTAISAVGDATYADPSTLVNDKPEVLYSACGIVQKYLAPHSTVSTELIEKATQSLIDEFFSFLGTLHPTSIPAAPPNQPLFKVLVFRVSAGACQIDAVDVVYHNNGKEIGAGHEVVDHTARQLRFYAYGRPEVINELTIGSDPRFSDLREHPDIKNILSSEKELLTKEEAIRCAQLLIRESANRIPLLTGSPSTISPTSDVAFIDEKTGFGFVS